MKDKKIESDDSFDEFGETIKPDEVGRPIFEKIIESRLFDIAKDRFGFYCDRYTILLWSGWCMAKQFGNITELKSIDKKNKKTLSNTNSYGAKQNVSDLVLWGDSDVWNLLSKASSKSEGWIKSTKALYIPDVGCLVQVTTQQGDNVAEAVSFVPGVCVQLIYDEMGALVGRTLRKETK